MATLFVRIPDERIGVVIGPGRSTKHEIETKTGAHLTIDTEDGQVEVTSPDDVDPTGRHEGPGHGPRYRPRLLAGSGRPPAAG